MEFIDWLQQQYLTFNKVSPWAAGIVLAGLMGFLYAILRQVPKTVYSATLKQCMTSLTFNNATAWSEDRVHFTSFMQWFCEQPWSRYSRNISLESPNSRTIIGPGFGTHFFVYKRRLYWFKKEALNSQGSTNEKERVTIFTWGRNQQVLKDLVSSFMPKENSLKSRIYTYTGDQGWQYLCEIKKRPLKTVAMNKATKDKLIFELEQFYESEEWYNERGMAYKSTFVIHGKPGTGKTSIIKALAAHFGKNICTININSMDDTSFEKALSHLPPNSVVLIEDFDSSAAFKARTPKKPKVEPVETLGALPAAPAKKKVAEANIFEALNEEFSRLTLSKVLNVLDGVVSLNGTVIFMTTNHIDKIDDAVVRKGRVDHLMEIGYLTDVEVREYIHVVFPEHTYEFSGCFEDIAGCDLQALFLEHRRDPDAFIASIPTLPLLKAA
jgi:hypothetical protein